MAKFKIKKIKWKKLLSVVLACAAVLGLIGGAAALFGKDTKTIGPGEFSVGALDDSGVYMKNQQAIYTKEAFACDGLKVVPDFEAELTYDIYYYDASNNVLDVKKGLTEAYEESFPGADTARIVIYPDVPDGEKADEFKISFWEVRGYAKKLTITTNRDQTSYKAVTTDLYKAVSMTGAFTKDDVSKLDSNVAVQASEVAALNEKCEFYRVYVKLSAAGDDVPVDIAFMQGQYVDEDGTERSDNKAIAYNGKYKVVNEYAHTFDTATMQPDVWYSVVVEAPEDANHIRVQGPADAEYRIYGIVVK